MTVLDGILLSLGADTSRLADLRTNPYGRGHILTNDRVFKCAGTLQPNPDFDPALPVSDTNPEQVVVDRHVLGTITAVPQGWAGVATEDTSRATFTLDPAQVLINPENPVCQVCGQHPAP